MRLLMMGAPGAGKGSQAAVLSERLGIPAISTGDIFRTNVREGTYLGLQVTEILRAGDYVPDALTNEMVRARLTEPDARDGFILDGYPRTPHQVIELDRILAVTNVSIDAVIHLVVPAEQLIERLTSRGAEEGRSDDTAEAIRHRLSVFESVTAPILTIYSQRDLMVTVPGTGTPAEVGERLLWVISEEVARS